MALPIKNEKQQTYIMSEGTNQREMKLSPIKNARGDKEGVAQLHDICKKWFILGSIDLY